MRRKRTVTSRARMEELIEEGTIDCYDDGEAIAGMEASVQDGVVCPFGAKVSGETIKVLRLESAKRGVGIDAVYQHKRKRCRVNLASLEFVEPLPEGFDWIEAYFVFLQEILM